MAVANTYEAVGLLILLLVFFWKVWNDSAKVQLRSLYTPMLLGLGGLCFMLTNNIAWALETDEDPNMETFISDFCDVIGVGLLYTCCIWVLIYTNQKAEERGKFRTILCYLAPLFLGLAESFEVAFNATDYPNNRVPATFSVMFESLVYATLMFGTMLSIYDGSTRPGCRSRVILTLACLILSFILFAIGIIVDFREALENSFWWFVPTDLLLCAVPIVNLFFIPDFTPPGQKQSEESNKALMP
jgi:hypothetical protein